jgi:hypothetical protein
MTKKRIKTSSAALIEKIFADAASIRATTNVRVIIRPISPTVQQFARRREEKRAALTRQANELFATIRAGFGLEEARRIFTIILKDNPIPKGKRRTKENHDINFALLVHVLESKSPRRTAEKFASDLGVTVPTLETRIKRSLKEARTLAL